jgi:hypothetical protein
MRLLTDQRLSRLHRRQHVLGVDAQLVQTRYCRGRNQTAADAAGRGRRRGIAARRNACAPCCRVQARRCISAITRSGAESGRQYGEGENRRRKRSWRDLPAHLPHDVCPSVDVPARESGQRAADHIGTTRATPISARRFTRSRSSPKPNDVISPCARLDHLAAICCSRAEDAMDAGSRPASFAMSRNFGRTSAISPQAVGIQPPVSLHPLRHCRSSRRPVLRAEMLGRY